MSAPVRVLQWSYASSDARRTCALSLDATRLLYAFRTSDGPPTATRGNGVEATAPNAAASHAGARHKLELYAHVGRALERQGEFEADLLQRGFHLDTFETVWESA